jgi:Amt family ammonium transporter
VGTVFAIVFTVSFALFFLLKHTIGIRVSAEDEDAGLDISETGMYGYPETFIPPSELVGTGLPHAPPLPSTPPAGITATAMSGEGAPA